MEHNPYKFSNPFVQSLCDKLELNKLHVRYCVAAGNLVLKTKYGGMCCHNEGTYEEIVMLDAKDIKIFNELIKEY